jgi:hypothetical protein
LDVTFASRKGEYIFRHMAIQGIDGMAAGPVKPANEREVHK